MHAAARLEPYFARRQRERGRYGRRVPGQCVVGRFVRELFEHRASERQRVAAVLPNGPALSGFLQWL